MNCLLGTTLAVVVVLSAGACTSDPSVSRPPAAADFSTSRPQVITTSWPVDWLVERIAGDAVDRRNILPIGEDPQSWRPQAELIATLQDADLIVTNGAGYESWIATATLPLTRLVSSANDLDLISMVGPTHSHGRAGVHSHSGTDPHTWSDPLLLLEQARQVHRALERLDPDRGRLYAERLAVLEEELRELHRAYERALSGLQDRPLAANHPAYNYLARRYDLDLESFDFDSQTVPTQDQLSSFGTWFSEQETAALLWEAEPAVAVRQAFPASLRHVWIDPLEQPRQGGEYDYLRQAHANVERYRALLARPSTRTGE